MCEFVQRRGGFGQKPVHALPVGIVDRTSDHPDHHVHLLSPIHSALLRLMLSASLLLAIIISTYQAFTSMLETLLVLSLPTTWFTQRTFSLTHNWSMPDLDILGFQGQQCVTYQDVQGSVLSLIVRIRHSLGMENRQTVHMHKHSRYTWSTPTS